MLSGLSPTNTKHKPSKYEQQPRQTASRRVRITGGVESSCNHKSMVTDDEHIEEEHHGETDHDTANVQEHSPEPFFISENATFVNFMIKKIDRKFKLKLMYIAGLFPTIFYISVYFCDIKLEFIVKFWEVIYILMYMACYIASFCPASDS